MQPVEKLEEKIKQTIAYLRANGIPIPPELLPIDDLNPLEVTAQQIRADRFGSANVVKYKLGNHVKDADNPHEVTAEQVGADRLGSADVVKFNLISHVQDTDNPHNVTAKQIGAEELGGVDDVLTQLGQHTLDLENPHRVTAAQLDVDNIGPLLDEHIQNSDNPHGVTSEQVGSPRLVIDAEVDHLVAFLTLTGEQKDSGKGIWDFAPAEHTHPPTIPMVMGGGVKQMTLTAGDLTATAPLLFNITRQVVGGPADVSIPMATALVDGYLSAIDWTIFNNKQNALVFPLAPNLGGTGVNNGANNLTIPATGTAVLGTGAAGQVGYWSGANNLTGSPNFTWDNNLRIIRLTSTVLTTYLDYIICQSDHANFGGGLAVVGSLGAQNGGNLDFTAGEGTASFGGYVQFRAGPGGVAGGDIFFYGGAAVAGGAGDAGVIQFIGGAGQGIGRGTDIVFTSGDGGAAGLAGDVSFTLGKGVAASLGRLIFVNSNTGIQTLLNVASVAAVDKTFTFPNVTGTFALLEAANSFTLINPITTIAESWIGPSNLTGIYFKNSFVGMGTTNPLVNLHVYQAATFAGMQLETGLAGSIAFISVKNLAGSWNFEVGRNTASNLEIYNPANNTVLSITQAGLIAVGRELYGRFDFTFPTAGAGYYRIRTTNTDATSGGIGIDWLNAGAFVEGMSITTGGVVVFNDTGLATSDLRAESDTYDALFIDSSNDSIEIMSNVAGKVGFYGIAAVAQPAGAAQVAPAAYATGIFGLDSDAHMQALYDLVVAMRLALVNLGIIKGAA